MSQVKMKNDIPPKNNLIVPSQKLSSFDKTLAASFPTKIFS